MRSSEHIISILRQRDLMFEIYDYMRLNHEHVEYRLFKKFNDLKTIFDNDFEEFMETNNECLKVTVLQKTKIKNEKTIEIETNLTGCMDDISDKIIFEGVIPNNCDLRLMCEYSEVTGMHFYIKKYENRKLPEDFVYNTEFSNSVDSNSCVIEKGTTIALALVNNLDINIEDKTKKLILTSSSK